MKQALGLASATTLLSVVPRTGPVHARPGGGERLEKTRLVLGIIPLTDCAPIVVARELGYFAKHGLEVEISREASWASVRDKVAVGALDGAHMLAGMPIASSLGVGGRREPMVTAFSMDLNGNAITVSSDLYRRMEDADPQAMEQRPLTARALKKVIDRDRAAGRPPMTFATVFPVSTHNYQLRYWMAAAGIDPQRDVRLVVVPPPQMVASLEAGNIVGYCVGEPWNARAVELGIGRTLITSYEIWNNCPEKVFGVTREWAQRHPNTHKALVKGLLEAARWADRPENRMDVVRIISGPQYVDAPPSVVKMSMTGTFRYAASEPPAPLPDFNVFFRYAATFPWRSHAAWFITQMLRWGQIPGPLDVRKAAEAVYRSDIYREAARELGIPYPTQDYKPEGVHSGKWTLAQASAPIEMGPDRFFDGMGFEPDRIMAYLEGFPICHYRVAGGRPAETGA